VRKKFHPSQTDHLFLLEKVLDEFQLGQRGGNNYPVEKGYCTSNIHKSPLPGH
jgi:hypothetical protein